MAALGCRVLTPVVNGTIWPASTAVETWDKLVDGQIFTSTNPLGSFAQTAAASAPYMQLVLDSPYADISGVTLYPATADVATISESMNLTVVLSASSNFSTDAAAVYCVRKLDHLVERMPVFVPCGGVAVSFVTIQRVNSNATASLTLQEVMIWRSTGVANCVGSAPDICKRACAAVHAPPCNACMAATRSMPCHAGPAHAGPGHAGPCRARPCHAMQGRAMPCRAGPGHAMPGHASLSFVESRALISAKVWSFA
jgi:hypothetical protein